MKKSAAKNKARPTGREELLEGLRRLAYARPNDAVRLAAALADEEGALPDIEELDLFLLSELKKTKGGCEVRFINRLDAFEKLASYLLADGEADPGGLEEALKGCAQAIDKRDGAYAD